MSFYLNLPSNSSHKYYPNNKVGSYKIKLPYKLCLSSDYQVALTEITFVNSFGTFIGGDSRDNHILFDRKVKSLISYSASLIPVKYYKNIEDLLESINYSIPDEYSNDVKFYIEKKTNRVSVSIKNNSEVILSNKISIILGFNGDVLLKEKINIAKQSHNIYDERYHMFIYSDIVESQIVGSSLVPLLRMVDISGKEEVNTVHFQNPYYLNLSRFEIDTISVMLCDAYGDELSIDRGYITLTLHFKSTNK